MTISSQTVLAIFIAYGFPHVFYLAPPNPVHPSICGRDEQNDLFE
jgi:hypothetical protein